MALDPAVGILGLGDEAPDFDLPSSVGGRTRLSDVLDGRAGAVVYFFPKAFTTGCTTEVTAFGAHRHEFDGADVAVIGISRDEPARLAEFSREHGADGLLLCDADRAVHQAYGVLSFREVDGEQVEKVRRATFFVGPDRTVRRAWHDVSVDGHVLDVLGGVGTSAPGE